MKQLNRLFAIGLLLCGIAQAEPLSGEPIELGIDAQPMPQALKEFARQSGYQLFFQSEVAKDFTSPEIKGTLTPEAALDQLLANTGLYYRFVNSHTIAIRRKEVSQAEDPDKAVAHLAQAGNTTTDSAQEQIRPAVSATNPSADGSGGGRSIEEVIVTAQKRAERLQDVPISIVAMGADELQKRKITSLDQLSSAVPGLAIQNAGGGNRRIMLRGLSNVFGTSSLIGLYLDEASVTTTAARQLDLRTYDLERVEVLRGPQGTLYGEGSVGGTIRFITKNPVLNAFEMKADVAATFTEDGAPGQRIESAINVPLIENELGLRIAGTYDRGAGWMDQPAANKKDIDDQDLVNVRVKGLWQPAPQFTVNAMAVIHRNDSAPTSGEDENGNFTQTFNLTTTPDVHDEYELYNLSATYEFAGARLLSATSYIEQEKVMSNLAQRGQYAAPPTPRFDALFVLNSATARVLSEELRLTSTGSGPWTWTAGGFYRNAHFADGSTLRVGLPILPGAPLPTASSNASKTFSESWAVFGDASYDVTERLTLGVGLRYFKDEVELTSGLAPAVTFQEGGFHALNPRLYAEYKLTDRVNTYASVAKGFRSGGFNSLNRPSYGPESVWTYELGTKIAVLDNRLTADAAVFYSDYTNYQILGFRLVGATPTNITSNAGNARVQGIEWAVSWLPAELWTLSLGGSYVHSKFYEIDALSSTHAVGDPLDLFPEYGYTASAQRDFQWAAGKPGFARVDYNEQGRETYRNRSVGAWFFNESDIINMLNFNVGLQWSPRLSLSVFAQNLLNDRGFADPFGIEEIASRSRPRTFGIGFGVNFE